MVSLRKTKKRDIANMKNQLFPVYMALLMFLLPANLWAVSTHWQKMSSPVSQSLNAIWGRSRTDIFAVGNNGMILHYNGTAWRNQVSPVQTDLNAIWGNETDIYIVGDNGLILKREYQTWATMLSGTENDLLDIWGIADNDIFAVGKKGTILRNTSGIWFEMASRTLSTLNSVWGAAGPVFVCGSGGKLLQLKDNQWSALTGQTFNSLNAIWGQSDNFLYTVGASGVILKYQAGTWSETIEESFINLHAVWGFSDGKVFAGGYRGTILFHDTARPEWTPMDTDTTDTIKDLWGTSSQDVYAVGENGLILHLKQRLMIDGPLEVNETDKKTSYDIHLVYALNDDLVVSLESNDPNSIVCPDEIIIPAGILKHSFNVDILDDIDIDGNAYITLTATAENWYSGSIMVLMVDDEIRNLKLIVPDFASEGDAVMEAAGQISIPGIFQDSLIVHLTSDKTDKVIVPGSIEIQAGEQIAAFDMTILDNNIMDGMVPVLISASAPGWQPVTATITIADNEGAQLTVTVMEKAVEGTGVIHNAGWVTLASVLRHDFEVTLTSDDPSSVEIPYTLVVPAGKTIAMFDMTINDDDWISDPRSVKIKVEARGWYTGIDSIIIEDNDPRTLTLSLPETANEADGTLTHAAQIEIPGLYTSDITIEIHNSAPDVLNTPRYVLLSAGQKSTDFTISVIDNAIISDVNSHPLTLTAFAPGWLTTSTIMEIIDNERKDLGLWVVESPQENGGNIAHAGTISIPGTYHQDLMVYLKVSNTDRIFIPDQIQIDAGEMSQTFDMSITDDQEIGEKEYITIIAEAPGWKAITGLTSIVDDEKKEIYLSIPTKAAEGDSPLLQSGKIEIPGNYRQDLAISLSVNKINQIDIPDMLLIPEGSISVLFDIVITDNATIDLLQEVTISASIMGFSDWTPDKATIFISDNEPKALYLSVVPNVTEGSGTYRNLGKISIPGRYIYDLPITLTSSNVGIIQPPKSIVLPMGYTQISFDCQIMDNNEINGLTDVELTASSQGWTYSSTIVQITDDEICSISIHMPDTFVEGSGTYTNVAWVMADGLVPSNIPITLQVSPDTDVSIPSQITLGQGTAAVAFDLTIYDNSAIDSNQSFTLTATPIGAYSQWTQAVTHFEIIDNESKKVILSIPSGCNEGIGLLPSAGLVKIPGHMPTPLWVQLSVMPETDIAVPEWITIPEGETQSGFDITVADNHRIEGPQTIEISAKVNLPEWSGSTAEIILADNEVYQLTLNIPSTAQENAGTLTAAEISLDGTLANQLQVQLMSTDTSLVSVPKQLVVPPNEFSVFFPLTIHDNYWITGEQTIAIYVYAQGFPVVHKQIVIHDDDRPQLTLWIPDQATVGDGLLSHAGILSMDGLFETDLETRLTSDMPEIVSIYEQQIIPAGQSTIFFDIFISDALEDMSQLVAVSVFADGFIGDIQHIRVKRSDAPANGDFNNDAQIDLTDLIIGLQTLSGIPQTQPAIHGDVDQDGGIGIGDILFVFMMMME